MHSHFSKSLNGVLGLPSPLWMNCWAVTDFLVVKQKSKGRKSRLIFMNTILTVFSVLHFFPFRLATGGSRLKCGQQGRFEWWRWQRCDWLRFSCFQTPFKVFDPVLNIIRMQLAVTELPLAIASSQEGYKESDEGTTEVHLLGLISQIYSCNVPGMTGNEMWWTKTQFEIILWGSGM